jgi:hypothetical protein
MEAQDSAVLAEYFRESARRLPGPAYYQVLRWIHRTLRPGNYLEIGVDTGISLDQAHRSTPAIGVDPAPHIQVDLPDTVTIYDLTSDEFFARHDVESLLGGPVELAFIDGLHLFEQVLADFINIESHCGADSVIILHDTIPFDETTASRDRTTDFYCGDVWKTALALRRLRPELEMTTVRTAPTGLCMVRNLDRDDGRLQRDLEDTVAAYRDLDFGYYTSHRDEMPREISNDRDEIADWLSRPAQPAG